MPASLDAYRQLIQTRRDADLTLQAAQREVRKLDKQLQSMAKELVVAQLGPDQAPEALVFGIHPCPSSPVAICCYDHEQDRAHDGCLFCGEPHERK